MDVGTNVELEKGTLSAILEQSEIKRHFRAKQNFQSDFFGTNPSSDWLIENQIENPTSSEIVKNHENRVSKVETVWRLVIVRR